MLDVHDRLLSYGAYLDLDIHYFQRLGADIDLN